MLSQYLPTSAYTYNYNALIGSKNKPVILLLHLRTTHMKLQENIPLVDGIDGDSRDSEIFLSKCTGGICPMTDSANRETCLAIKKIALKFQFLKYWQLFQYSLEYKTRTEICAFFCYICKGTKPTVLFSCERPYFQLNKCKNNKN